MEVKINVGKVIVRETEKAYATEALVIGARGSYFKVLYWPKSRAEVTENGLRVEPWLVDAKADEVRGTFAFDYHETFKAAKEAA